MMIRTALCATTMLAVFACSAAPSPDASDDGNVDPTNDPSSPSRGSAANPTGTTNTPGAAAGAGVIDLGSVNAGAETHFDVPAGTRGFTILVDASIVAGDAIGVQELRDPSGALVVGDFLDVSHPGRLVTGDDGTGIAALTVPLVDDHATQPLKSGRWTVKLGGSTAAAKGTKGAVTPLTGKSLHGAVRLQSTDDGAFHGGVIDLDLYVPDGLVVGGAGTAKGAATGGMVTASSAANDTEMKARLDLVFDLFQRLYGVGRGDVRFHAIASSLVVVSGQDGVDAANILATAQNAHAAAQVILTNRLSPDGDDSEISGISNCLPGALGVPGTKCSAVVVAFRSGSPAWQDAATMVHELGHFVGLAHTTELGGDGDTLTDTPECQDTTKSALSSCADHDNLMFPSVNLATDEASIAVSETQRAIFRSSAIYRATSK